MEIDLAVYSIHARNLFSIILDRRMKQNMSLESIAETRNLFPRQIHAHTFMEL